ncbi:MAG: hypothetical protein FJW20_01255 [Acidimicrobiia bacterium]|nr:hypothetical protein [Acidimicrobiia bacterium]
MADSLNFTSEDLWLNRKHKVSRAQRLRLFKEKLVLPLKWAMVPIVAAIGFRIGVSLHLEAGEWTEILGAIGHAFVRLQFETAAKLIWTTDGATPAYYNYISYAILGVGARQIKRLPGRLVLDLLFGMVKLSQGRTTTYTTERQVKQGRVKELETVYVCSCGELELEVSPEVFEAFGRVGVYKLYHLRMSKHLLSAEPITDDLEKAKLAAEAAEAAEV